MIKRLLQATALVAAVVGMAGVGQSSTVSATVVDEEKKVTICHRTASYNNPYVKITVDQDAADGDLGNDNGKGDHYSVHTGPVFYPTIPKHMKWGDIIPPIEGVHEGRNWTPEGIAIYENDCKPVEPYAVLDYSYVCDVKTEVFTLTVTNSGDAEGEFTLNGDTTSVAAGDSVEVSLPAGKDGAQVTLVINGETVLDRKFFCIQGRGASGGGDTDEVESLPVTSGDATAGTAAAVVALLIAATVGGYALHRRSAFNA